METLSPPDVFGRMLGGRDFLLYASQEKFAPKTGLYFGGCDYQTFLEAAAFSEPSPRHLLGSFRIDVYARQILVSSTDSGKWRESVRAREDFVFNRPLFDLFQYLVGHWEFGIARVVSFDEISLPSRNTPRAFLSLQQARKRFSETTNRDPRDAFLSGAPLSLDDIRNHAYAGEVSPSWDEALRRFPHLFVQE